jgi:hypothetical protein
MSWTEDPQAKGENMKAARIQSRIDAVTVHRDGARVRRISELIATDSGYPACVCLTGLPLVMQDGSVRVSVEPASDGGAQGALPVASDIRVTLDVPDGSDSLAAPVEAELEAAHKELRRLSGRVSQVKRELSRMERLVITARPRSKQDRQPVQAPLESPTSARISLLEFREERERGLRKELAALEAALRDAERAAKALEIRHNRATTARQAHEHELRKALVVSLCSPEGEVAPRAHLRVEYLVPGARWAPAYTVRLTPGEQASFAMRALVAQQTGEDWSAVALTLSTADAQSWVELPELSSVRIGRRQPRPARTGWRPPPSGADELYGDYDREYGNALPSAAPTAFMQWEDQTREITIPRRSGDALVTRMTAAADFEEVTDQYDDAPVDSMELIPPSPAAAASLYSAAPELMPELMPEQSPARGRLEAKARRSVAASAYRALADEGAASLPGAPQGLSMPAEELARSGGSHAEGGLAIESSHAVAASSELLAYADLRMPPPSSDRRGTLQPAERMEIYMEMLLSQRIEVSFNVLAVLGVAARRARDVLRADLPSRYRVASSDRYDYAYASETAIDVPSDGAFHSIALTTRRADVDLRYVVVPRESTDVFRLAEIANPLNAPILDGPMDVYLDKDFLLTSDVEFIPPGGRLSLGLGVEQAVKVSRNTSYREETSGLMRGSLLLKHEIRIEVQNHLERAIECEVRERIPATRKDEDDITINVERVSPKWTAYEPELASSPEAGLEGGHHWQVRIDGGGGRAALEVDYAVKIPAKYELVGGNRREA